MIKYFLSSHGHFASGLMSSLEILTGGNNNITVFDAYVDDRSVKEELEKFYESINPTDQVILLSDLYGGSVNQAMSLFSVRPNTTLIAGVNLALILELTCRDELDHESIASIVKASQEGMRIVNINADKAPSVIEDEFF